MTAPGQIELLVLLAVRTLGQAAAGRIADRLGLSESVVQEQLLDAQAHGWVAPWYFAEDGGWSLTDAGRSHGERLLAAELDGANARAMVDRVYRDFLPLNQSVAQACTDWQLTELGIAGTVTMLDHTISALRVPADALQELEQRLTVVLARFDGYHRRFAAAVSAAAADPEWITGIDRESAHRVWFELHEDLIATLGLTR